MKFKFAEGNDVGYVDGRFVTPEKVGLLVLGDLVGDEEGLDDGMFVVGRDDGCAEGDEVG